MKRIGTLVTALVICAMLSGCGGTEDTSPQTAAGTTSAAAATTTSTTTAATTAAPTETTTAATTSETTAETEAMTTGSYVAESVYDKIEASFSAPKFSVPVTYKGDFEYGGKTFKTLADVFAVESDKPIFGSTGNVVVCGFEKDGEAYRFAANMPDETLEAMYALDIFEEGYEQKQRDLVKDLEIAQADDLMADLPPQSELDKFVGKKGKSMLKAGFAYSGYSISEEATVFFLDNGIYSYSVEFEDELYAESEKEDFDAESLLPKLTVKSVTYNELTTAIYDIPMEETTE